MPQIGCAAECSDDWTRCRRLYGGLTDQGIDAHADDLRNDQFGLKVLGNGSVSKKVTVKAAAFSESAKEKIEKAGGKAEVV